MTNGEKGARTAEALVIDQALTRKIADLARLELSEEEQETFTSQLGQIISYISELQEVPGFEGSELLVHPVALEAPLREDKVVPFPVDSDGAPRVLQSAPDVLYDGFKVPSIL